MLTARLIISRNYGKKMSRKVELKINKKRIQLKKR